MRPAKSNSFEQWFSKAVPPSLWGDRTMFRLCWDAALASLRKPRQRREKEPEPDICCACEGGCKQPAGWGTGQGFADNTGPFRKLSRCKGCGEPVCTNPGCSKVFQKAGIRFRLCINCQDDAEDK